MFLASFKKIPDITIDELDKVTHLLKQNQCKDPHNIKSEVYIHSGNTNVQQN